MRTLGRPTLPIAERIWQYIEKTPRCWRWIGRLSPRGYAIIKHGGRTWRASRLMWTIFRGSIPDGLKVCHECDNTWCVNVERCLFLGTTADNNADMHAKRRHAHGERHGMAKLSDAEVVEIRSLWRPRRYPARRLAEEFGVTERMVWFILKNESRVDLADPRAHHKEPWEGQ